MGNEKCDHIIGYGRRHDDFGDGGLIRESVRNSWEAMMEDGDDYGGYSITIEFSYCPECGQKLED